MQFFLTRSNFQPALAAVLLAHTSLITGCATSSIPVNSRPATSKSTHSSSLATTTVARYGRYTLVELLPTGGQRDLMQQVVDVTIPGGLMPTVGEALRYVLLRSGYQLCDDRDEIRALDTLPLPAAHFHLGPLMLHDALQMLVGRAWRLQVDEAARRVCFTRQSGSDKPEHES